MLYISTLFALLMAICAASFLYLMQKIFNLAVKGKREENSYSYAYMAIFDQQSKKKTIIGILALFFLAVCFFKGGDTALFWVSEVWADTDEDGTTGLPYKYVIIGLLSLFGVDMILELVKSLCRILDENQDLRENLERLRKNTAKDNKNAK